jgi:diguanylate cyclase (GGDEF)-like protein
MSQRATTTPVTTTPASTTLATTTPKSQTVHRSDAPPKKLDLLRHFSIACLLGMLVAMVSTTALVAAWARQNVVDQGAKANVDLATVFANGVWIEHAEDIRRAGALQPHELQASDAIAKLRTHALNNMRGTAVVKIKLYSLDGLTLFSTDAMQIGTTAAGNEGLRAAASGQVASTLTQRDTFDAFEGTREHRDVLASYVPMRAADAGRVEAVLEIYSDVTDLIATVQHSQRRMVAIVVMVLLLLYAFLFLVIRKADRLLRSQDVDREQREAQVWHQAHHDPLTGLPNRSLFAHDLEALLAKGGNGASGALLYVDLDRFKMVNDGFGHHAGDDVLEAAAKRMGGCLRAEDRLYRIGGDEFAIVLAQRTPDDAAAVAVRVTQAMGRPIERHGQTFTLGATIGIALTPRDGVDADSLVNNANAAMRSAKRDQRGQHLFYNEHMNESSRARLALEADLQRAFDQREFVLHYQPRVNTSRGEFGSVEALIRWQHPGYGLMAPAEFIGVLEQMDLITRVGEWVLHTACAQLRRWHDQGHVGLGVSVNVSARQLDQPDFADMVNRVIASTGVNPRSLELELTESVLIARTEQAQRMLSGLRAQGVRVAIDDFGTGYASLTYLRQLAVDVVKLDRTFVAGIEHNAKDRALSTAIAEMARALYLTLVAEGVETEAQVRFLESIGCTEMQGFLFSRPQPADVLDSTLAAFATRRRIGLRLAAGAASMSVNSFDTLGASAAAGASGSPDSPAALGPSTLAIGPA